MQNKLGGGEEISLLLFGIKTYTFSAAYEALVRLISREVLLKYFELTDVRPSQGGELNIYLEEKNPPSTGYYKSQLVLKDFLPKTAIQDFPIRGH